MTIIWEDDEWMIVRGPSPFNGRPGTVWVYDPRPGGDHWAIQHKIGTGCRMFADGCRSCCTKIPKEVLEIYKLLTMGVEGLYTVDYHR
jgi:hypothetical protein